MYQIPETNDPYVFYSLSEKISLILVLLMISVTKYHMFLPLIMMDDNNAQNVVLNAVKDITKYTLLFLDVLKSPQNLKLFHFVSSVFVSH